MGISSHMHTPTLCDIFVGCVFVEGDGQESDSDGEADEHDLDDEGGDLGTEECDKLDEQMWASDDDEPIKVTACSRNSSSNGRVDSNDVDEQMWASDDDEPVKVTTCNPNSSSNGTC